MCLCSTQSCLHGHDTLPFGSESAFLAFARAILAVSFMPFKCDFHAVVPAPGAIWGRARGRGSAGSVVEVNFRIVLLIVGHCFILVHSLSMSQTQFGSESTIYPTRISRVLARTSDVFASTRARFGIRIRFKSSRAWRATGYVIQSEAHRLDRELMSNQRGLVAGPSHLRMFLGEMNRQSCSAKVKFVQQCIAKRGKEYIIYDFGGGGMHVRTAV